MFALVVQAMAAGAVPCAVHFTDSSDSFAAVANQKNDVHSNHAHIKILADGAIPQTDNSQTASSKTTERNAGHRTLKSHLTSHLPKHNQESDMSGGCCGEESCQAKSCTPVQYPFSASTDAISLSYPGISFSDYAFFGSSSETSSLFRPPRSR